MRPPRNARGRLAGNQNGLEIAHLDDGAKAIVRVPVQRRSHDACWRCGTEFAATDLEALRRCAELAREAS